jgi:GNAT superfamily N-acetyltransferase
MDIANQVSLRHGTNEDYQFLWNLHLATMRDYVDQTWGWNDAFQKEYFASNFDVSAIEILEIDERPIGLISIVRFPECLFLRQIAVVPKFQGVGIGTRFISEFVSQANGFGIRADLQVLKVNPARALYERLGFRVFSQTDTHFKMTTQAEQGGGGNSAALRASP